MSRYLERDRNFRRRDDYGPRRNYDYDPRRRGRGDRFDREVNGDMHRRYEYLYPSPNKEDLFNQRVGAEALHNVTSENDYSVYQDVNVKVSYASGLIPVPPIEAFAELAEAPYELDSTIYDNTVTARYIQPTPIQKYALPAGMSGYDILACSQTGSGKTCAFLVPIIHRIVIEKLKLLTRTPGMHEDFSFKRDRFGGIARPFCVILAPTRELVQQTAKASWMLSHGTGVLTRVVYGGSPLPPQQDALQLGCDILVATPGRMYDFIKREVIDTSFVRFVVFDECDRMLDMGFEDQIRDIMRLLPGPTYELRDLEDSSKTYPVERQTLLFSATFPKEIRNMALDFLRSNRLVEITVGQIGSTNPNLAQRVVLVEHGFRKLDLLRDYLTGKSEELNRMLHEVYGSHDDAATAHNYPRGAAATGKRNSVAQIIIPYQTIVFTNFKMEANRIFKYFGALGCRVAVIHGDMSQASRENNLKLFKSGETNVLIATDVAQRGLDIPHVRLVLNYDVPGNIDDYIHRIGRTGRVGRPGLAITFIVPRSDPPNTLRDIRRKLREAKQPIPGWFDDTLETTSREQQDDMNDYRGNYCGRGDFNDRGYDRTGRFSNGPRRSNGRFLDLSCVNYEEVTSLLESGAGLSRDQELKVCRLAIAKGWSEIAERLEEAYRPEEGRTTMLMCAAMDRNLDLLKRYVHERRMQDENGWTALMFAAQAGHLECVQILLPEAWIRTTRPASDLAEKGTAMMLAAQAGHADIVELLWPYECCGKDANDHNAYWYAQKAAKNGERIREILDLEGQGKVRRREKVVEELSV
ncbi:Superfamily II DNA and RNA helicase [Giardia muris]|uniref:RNA helicase n=1 Tax=Giardia muris TaxID=5742 RepID=A0A4Z1SUQ3_GIAMU|nr:Superfamily II DNA and RNA helicase [Giardia muris]|eukprot:TNJ29576.1 Superfamily II DNA and RNA helicase [Giardia muris]